MKETNHISRIKRILFDLGRHVLYNIVAWIALSIISLITTGNLLKLFAYIIILPVWTAFVLLILISVVAIVYSNRIKPVLGNNAYWFPTKEGTLDGPFCTYCWDDHRKRIRLICRNPRYCKCPKCRNSYEIESDNKKKPRPFQLTKFLNEP